MFFLLNWDWLLTERRIALIKHNFTARLLSRIYQVEQRLRHRTRGNIRPGNRRDPGGGLPALPASRHPGGARLRTRAHRDPAGGRAGVLPEHLRAPSHANHSDLRPPAIRRRRELQRRVRRPAHQD